MSCAGPSGVLAALASRTASMRMRRAQPRTSGQFVRHRAGRSGAHDGRRSPLIGILRQAVENALATGSLAQNCLTPTIRSLHTSLRKQ